MISTLIRIFRHPSRELREYNLEANDIVILMDRYCYVFCPEQLVLLVVPGLDLVEKPFYNGCVL